MAGDSRYDADAPRWRKLPVDGKWYDIEVYPLLVDWSGKPIPRSPRGIVSVQAIDDTPFQHARDTDGWLYVRYDYPYGWATNDVHFSTAIAEAFATLAGIRWWERPLLL